MITVELTPIIKITITLQPIYGVGDVVVLEPSAPVTLEMQAIAKGDKGDKGDSGEGFNYTQSSPSDTWIIAHNLGLKPSVDIFSVGGLAMFGTVQHLSENVLNITFNAAVAGFARLN